MLKFITQGWFGADGFCTQLSPWFFRWVCMSVTLGLECTVSIWTGLFHQVPNTLKLCQNLEANAMQTELGPHPSSPFPPCGCFWCLSGTSTLAPILLKTYWPQAIMRVEVPYNCVTHWLQVQAKFLHHHSILMQSWFNLKDMILTYTYK